jgi:hypothetical protein
MTNDIPVTHAVTPALLILGLQAPTKSKLLPRRCNASDQNAGLSWDENRAAGRHHRDGRFACREKC